MLPLHHVAVKLYSMSLMLCTDAAALDIYFIQLEIKYWVIGYGQWQFESVVSQPRKYFNNFSHVAASSSRLMMAYLNYVGMRKQDPTCTRLHSPVPDCFCKQSLFHVRLNLCTDMLAWSCWNMWELIFPPHASDVLLNNTWSSSSRPQ